MPNQEHFRALSPCVVCTHTLQMRLPEGNHVATQPSTGVSVDKSAERLTSMRCLSLKILPVAAFFFRIHSSDPDWGREK